ncbi:unnamed protein product [Auanema sp. JU1783]|nr:unnamed protein product [Auanema sp. JU1783]
MRIWYILLMYSGILAVSAEVFSLLTSGVVIGGVGIFFAVKEKAKCLVYECCEDVYLKHNFGRMLKQLREEVFGQHLVEVDIWNSIVAHWKNSDPEKPLVLAFHGPTGCGKNHVSRIIADNLYTKGAASSFVHTFIATVHFPDKNKVSQYQKTLREKILEAGKKCGRSIFILDEVDKMPERLLETVKPFLDYYDKIDGIDFRKSIFIFLSNRGGDEIANMALSQYMNGKPREGLVLHDFERTLMHKAFVEEGGLKHTNIIKNQLIDHYVPFLPLERRHVVLCVHQFLRTRFKDVAEKLISSSNFMNEVLNSLQYFPQDSKVFSSSGCKRVAAKTQLEVFKLQKPSQTAGNHITEAASVEVREDDAEEEETPEVEETVELEENHDSQKENDDV